MAGELGAITQPEEKKKLAEKIDKRYRSGVNYKNSIEFYEKCAEYERFWQCDQWPSATERTKNLPRPATNYFKMIIEQKVSGLVYELPQIYFEPVEQTSEAENELKSKEIAPVEGGGPEVTRLEKAEKLTYAAKFLAEKMDLDSLLEAICRTSALMGVGIGYFPWDNTIVGGGPKSTYIGDIAGHEIDPTDFFPGDPSNPDVQSQPWIIVAERLPLEEVKHYYREFEGDIVDMLQPEKKTSDTMTYDQQHIDIDVTDYVDLIHQWWKEPVKDEEEDKEVVPKYKLNYAVQCQGYILREEEELYKHGLYPFISFCWNPKRKSFFGHPESADLISGQKEENRLAAISLLSAYQSGLPNVRYNPTWVKAEDIPLGPGGMKIPDRSPPGQLGISYVEAPSPARHIPRLRESIVAGLKDTAGVYEAWTGKAPTGGQLVASAIIALQEAAGIRIRPIQRRFHKAVREMGVLWLAHWKEFYNENRMIRITAEDGSKSFAWFKGEDYKDLEFDVKVQASISSPFSRAAISATLENMLEKQVIAPEEYLEHMPTEVFPKAKIILARRKQKEEQQVQRLIEQQVLVVTQIVEQLVTQARESGVPITPEAVQQLMQMLQAQGQEEVSPGQPV